MYFGHGRRDGGSVGSRDNRYTLAYRPRGWTTLATRLMPIVNLLFRWQTSWLNNAKTALEGRSPEAAAG